MKLCQVIGFIRLVTLESLFVGKMVFVSSIKPDYLDLSSEVSASLTSSLAHLSCKQAKRCILFQLSDRFTTLRELTDADVELLQMLYLFFKIQDSLMTI